MQEVISHAASSPMLVRTYCVMSMASQTRKRSRDVYEDVTELRQTDIEDMCTSTARKHGGHGCVVYGTDGTHPLAIKFTYVTDDDADTKWLRETGLTEYSVYRELQLRGGCPQLAKLRYAAVCEDRVILGIDKWDMDLCSMLQTRIWRGKVTVRQRLSILLDVAKGLRYMHTHSYVHCDMKADNVLVRRNTYNGWWQACIVDFGMAVRLPSDGVEVDRCDRPWNASYMPTDDKITAAFDAFSYGVLMARVLLLDFHEYEDAHTRLKEKLKRSPNRNALNTELACYSLPCMYLSDLVNAAIQLLDEDPRQRPDMEDMCLLLSDVLRGLGDLNATAC